MAAAVVVVVRVLRVVAVVGRVSTNYHSILSPGQSGTQSRFSLWYPKLYGIVLALSGVSHTLSRLHMDMRPPFFHRRKDVQCYVTMNLKVLTRPITTITIMSAGPRILSCLHHND
jgi:hypothetical protein